MTTFSIILITVVLFFNYWIVCRWITNYHDQNHYKMMISHSKLAIASVLCNLIAVELMVMSIVNSLIKLVHN